MRAGKDIMDSAPVFDNKFDRFKYWFTNVFWFHYKWPTIVIILAGAMLTSIIYSAVTNTEADFSFVFAVECEIDPEYAIELENEILKLVKEYTGKEKAKIDFTVLQIDPTSDMGMANIMLLSLQMSNDSTLLFILQDTLIEDMLEGESDYQSLEPYGFGDVKTIDVSDAPQLKALIYGQDANIIAGLFDKETASETISYLSIEILKYLTK